MNSQSFHHYRISNTIYPELQPSSNSKMRNRTLSQADDKQKNRNSSQKQKRKSPILQDLLKNQVQHYNYQNQMLQLRNNIVLPFLKRMKKNPKEYQKTMKKQYNPIMIVPKKQLHQVQVQNMKSIYMPDSREGAYIAQLNHYQAVAIGGYSNREIFDFPILDLDEAIWVTTFKNQSIAIGCNFAAVNYDESIYIFGGQKREGGIRNTNTLFKLDFKSNKIIYDRMIYKGQFIEPRRNHCCSLAGNFLIIIGGILNGSQYSRDIACINLINLNSYILKPQLEKGLAFHSSLALNADFNHLQDKNNKSYSEQSGIYIFGGKDNTNEVCSNMYLLKTHYAYHSIEKLKIFGKQPQPRHSATMDYVRNYHSIVIYGGTDDNQCFNDLHLYQLQNQIWIQLTTKGDKLLKRFKHCSIVNENRMIVFGGIQQEGYHNFETQVIEFEENQIKL